MSRGLWFVAGATAGVYAVTRARRVAEVFTADGLRDRLHALDVGARMFRDEVVAGREERAPALRRRLGLAPIDPGDGGETGTGERGVLTAAHPGPAGTPDRDHEHEHEEGDH